MGNELLYVYTSPAVRPQAETACFSLLEVIFSQADLPLVPINGKGMFPSVPKAPVVTRLVFAPVIFFLIY